MERGNEQALRVRSAVMVKKLFCPAAPRLRVLTVESWKFQSHRLKLEAISGGRFILLRESSPSKLFPPCSYWPILVPARLPDWKLTN